jgi:sugar/nucleoside kinase (ribokinase family)
MDDSQNEAQLMGTRSSRAFMELFRTKSECTYPQCVNTSGTGDCFGAGMATVKLNRKLSEKSFSLDFC